MNKKGFTLTELILTVGLLAVLGMVIVSNMSGLLEKNKDENYQAFVKTLEDAACTFVDLKAANNHPEVSSCKSNNGCNVKVQYLLEEGLITEKQMINPKTNANVKDKNVKVTYPNNLKTCKYLE